MEGWKSGFRTFYLSDFISNTQIFAFVLTIVPAKNNETHLEIRTRGPRPYEQSSVEGKVSD